MGLGRVWVGFQCEGVGHTSGSPEPRVKEGSLRRVQLGAAEGKAGAEARLGLRSAREQAEDPKLCGAGSDLWLEPGESWELSDSLRSRGPWCIWRLSAEGRHCGELPEEKADARSFWVLQHLASCSLRRGPAFRKRSIERLYSQDVLSSLSGEDSTESGVVDWGE